MKQAPGSNEEIAEFRAERFGASFRQFDKIDVNGAQASPLYDLLKKVQPGLGSGAIKWNFTKFLVSRQGEVVARYAPTKKPEAIKAEIIKLLEA